MAETLPPSLDQIEAMARSAWGNMPGEFRRLAGDLLIRIEEFADDEILDAMDIEDPWELTGLYQGVDLPQRSVSDPTPDIPIVFLYRRPILDEWIERGDVTLEDLVAHVLVHEIGHHFGFSDADMDAILDRTD